MTKTQMVKINMIANSIKNMEVSSTDEKIYEIVNTIMEERKRQKLSQDELAIKSGLTKNTISRIETFVSTPTLPVLIQISHALGLDLFILQQK